MQLCDEASFSNHWHIYVGPPADVCLIQFGLGSVLTVGVRDGKVVEDGKLVTFIACGGGADTVHTLI